MELINKEQVLLKNMVSAIINDDFKFKDIQTAYWSVEPSDEPSLEILVAMLKIKEFVENNIHVTILLADVHAFLNNPLEENQIDDRINYYKFIISTVLSHFNVDQTMYTFVKGSDTQLDKRYIIDLFKFMNIITVSNAMNTSKNIPNHQKNIHISKVIYPLMQVLDETVIDADIQLVCENQKKIIQLSLDHISKIGYNTSNYLMYGHIPHMQKYMSKKSALLKNDKIYLTDSFDDIKYKIMEIKCSVKTMMLISDNPCLAIAKHVCYPWGYTVSNYQSYADMIDAMIKEHLSVDEFKTHLIDAIEKIISQFRNTIVLNKELWNMVS